jgi:hypothetical protein
MLNLPKLPKLYYYIAGLAVFVLILGGAGFYFYQKENTASPSPDSTSAAQNTLTNFEKDQSKYVIEFKECNMTLKVHNPDQIQVYYRKLPDQIHALLISPYSSDKYYRNQEAIICGDTQTKTISILKRQQDTPAAVIPFWLLEYQSNLKINQSDFSPPGYLNFKYGDLFYEYKFFDSGVNFLSLLLPSTTNHQTKSNISSIKFDTNVNNNFNLVPIINIDNQTKQNTTFIINYYKNLKPIEDISLFGCDDKFSFIDFRNCTILDQNENPIALLNDSENKFSIDNFTEVELGKKTDSGRYIITKFENLCTKTVNVYNFNFIDGSFKKEVYLDTLNTRECLTNQKDSEFALNWVFSDKDLNKYADVECFRYLEGEKVRKCFKSEEYYQKYIKEYNDEQAKNKAAQTELSKYLE